MQETRGPDSTATPHLQVFKARSQYSQGLPSRRGTSVVFRSLECVPPRQPTPTSRGHREELWGTGKGPWGSSTSWRSRATALHTHLMQGRRPGYHSHDQGLPRRAPALLPGRRASVAIGSRVVPRDLKGTPRRFKPPPSRILAALLLPGPAAPGSPD